MSAKTQQAELVLYYRNRMRDILQMRNNLAQDDLEYVVNKINKMSDERLKECITSLLGWGDDERAELETFCAIAIELMKDATPYKLRNAARTVELRYLNRKLGDK